MVASIHFRISCACVSDHFQLWGNSPNEACLGVSCHRKRCIPCQVPWYCAESIIYSYRLIQFRTRNETEPCDIQAEVFKCHASQECGVAVFISACILSRRKTSSLWWQVSDWDFHYLHVALATCWKGWIFNMNMQTQCLLRPCFSYTYWKGWLVNTNMQTQCLLRHCYLLNRIIVMNLQHRHADTLSKNKEWNSFCIYSNNSYFKVNLK